MHPDDLASDESIARRFELHVLSHIDVAWRMAKSLARDDDRAQDLVQDATLRAFRAFPRVRHQDNLRSWLARIVHTTFLDQIRYEQRRPTTSIEEDSIDEASLGVVEFEPEVFGESLDDELTQALDALPQAWRLTTQLVDVEGMNYEEAADVLGIPVGTVRSRLHRARKALYESLRERREGRPHPQKESTTAGEGDR